MYFFFKTHGSNGWIRWEFYITFFTLIHPSKNLNFLLFLRKRILKSFSLVFFLNFPFLLFHSNASFHIYICFSFPVKCSNQWARLPVSKDLLSVWGHRGIFGRGMQAQSSFLWQCYTEGYCQTEHHIDQNSWGRAIRTNRNYLWVGLIFF